MAKNKYTVVWKPDFEVNMFVTWIELDFEIQQYMPKTLWKEFLQALVSDFSNDEEDLDKEFVGAMYEVEAVFEGHLDSKWSNM